MPGKRKYVSNSSPNKTNTTNNEVGPANPDDPIYQQDTQDAEGRKLRKRHRRTNKRKRTNKRRRRTNKRRKGTKGRGQKQEKKTNRYANTKIRKTQKSSQGQNVVNQNPSPGPEDPNADIYNQPTP